MYFYFFLGFYCISFPLSVLLGFNHLCTSGA